jgi:hypothetical protein
VLEFDNGNSYLFKGKIQSNGMCEINIPKFKEEDDTGGIATLEVIAESAFFEPWHGNFVIRSRRSVQVEGVQVSTDTQKRVLIKNVGSTSNSKDHKLIESILKTYNPKSKRMLDELNDYEPTKKVKDWARRVFKNKVNSPQARYCMMVLEERIRKINKKR